MYIAKDTHSHHLYILDNFTQFFLGTQNQPICVAIINKKYKHTIDIEINNKSFDVLNIFTGKLIEKKNRFYFLILRI